MMARMLGTTNLGPKGFSGHLLRNKCAGSAKWEPLQIGLPQAQLLQRQDLQQWGEEQGRRYN